jgi:hypothetical protein
MQYQTKLYLFDIGRFSRELFYQQVNVGHRLGIVHYLGRSG